MTTLSSRLKELLAKATPGPWTIKPYGLIRGGDFIKYTKGSVQSQVALFCCQENISSAERDTNAELCAELISSAPAIIAALEAAELWKKFTAMDADVYINTTGESCGGLGFGDELSKIIAALEAAEKEKA